MGRRQIVIIDIDGTIANLQGRLNHIAGNKPADWDAFFDDCEQDKPFLDIVRLLEVLDEHYWFVYITGRPERIRRKTERWLAKWLPQTQSAPMFMRADFDYRTDDVVKKELFEKANLDLQQVAFVLEDRDRVVKMWRELGLRCLQVAGGDF